jgi:PepSY-associated transmembrane protein
MAPGVVVKRSLIVVHRWLGVVLSLVFLVWFASGIGMMYWTYPTVTARDRVERAAVLDPATIKLSPEEAWKAIGADDPPAQIRLNTFDGRPVYRFGGRGGQQIVYADTGEEQFEVPMEMVRRAAAAWTRQPIANATVEELNEPDQWTLQGRFADRAPLYKFSWPNGEQVYVSGNTGEIEQYTTTASRWGAYVSAIPHWLYFTPLRKHGPEWSRIVIWSSAVGTGAAILGVVLGVWMYSPSKRYRNAGARTAIPYRGQKRLHTIFGLVFGVGAVTWAFSGLLSMDPFPRRTNRPVGGGEQIGRVSPTAPRAIQAALRGRVRLDAFANKHPREVVARLTGPAPLDVARGHEAGHYVPRVKELELIVAAGMPAYLATLDDGTTRIVPIDGDPIDGLTPQRVTDVVTRAAGTNGLAEIRTIDQYDRYYLDRTRERPLPVVLARLNDDEGTRYYIDPKTARVVASYSARNWMSRWAYHGLHSLDFPWLYNYRPLWDIVVITFMVGGTALCVTSLILAWRVIGRKLRAFGVTARADVMNEDLAAS